jgi:hypothetical protein
MNVGNGQQQYIRQQVFEGCSDGVQQGGGTAPAANIVLSGSGSGGGLMAVVDNKYVF